MNDWILIGCPVYKRDWILPFWFDAIEKQTFPLSRVGFIFLKGPKDQATLECLMNFSENHPELRCFDIVDDGSEDHLAHVDDGHVRRRVWSIHRFKRMAIMRNMILDRVVCHNPARYFSLDSDILLQDPNTLSSLYELTETKGAVSPLMFMVPPDNDVSTNFPNVMTFDSNGIGHRANDYPIGSVFQADVIMAGVMMSPKVYTESRYHYHRQGEDLGWAWDCRQRGLDLWSASNIYAPHIMYRSDLENYLNLGDPRGNLAYN
jgi:hypothetical protein